MVERCISCAKHLAGLAQVQVFCLDVLQKRYLGKPPSENTFCFYCHREGCEPLNTCLYGCHEAYRWNGKYIYYCPVGMIFVASSVSDEQGKLAAGLVAGPLLMGEPEDFPLQDGVFAGRLELLPVFSTRRVNDLAETMALLTAGISGRAHSFAGSAVYEQEKVLGELYSARQQFEEPGYCYPIDAEKKLQALIYRRDKKG